MIVILDFRKQIPYPFAKFTCLELKGKLFGHILRRTCLLWLPFVPGLMLAVGNYKNCLRQVYRAGIFTTAAAGADIGFSLRLGKPVFVRYHSHCLGRTDLCTCTAIGFIGKHHASVLIKLYYPHLNALLLRNTERLNSAGR